jgi:hypothetical protein
VAGIRALCAASLSCYLSPLQMRFAHAVVLQRGELSVASNKNLTRYYHYTTTLTTP